MICKSCKINESRAQSLFSLIIISQLLCLIHAPAFAQQGSNDHIFPSSAEAKPFIDFDSKGFLINRKRIFLVSAGMEYARVPHELWEDRLLRLKRCGFNCIEIYTFWNFHEPQEGEFDFSGDHSIKLNGIEIAGHDATFCPVDDNRIACYSRNGQEIAVDLPKGWDKNLIAVRALFVDHREPFHFEIENGKIILNMPAARPVIIYRDAVTADKIH